MRVLIISDKKAGHENQSIAFAKLKNLDFDIIKISPKYKLLQYVLDFFKIYINIHSVKIKNDYVAVVSTGSATYYTNKYISKKLHIKSIAIMLPSGFRYSDFDYILANEHDNPPKLKNIITLPISLSMSEPKGYISKSSKPVIGIILGGDNTIFSMSKERIKESLDYIFKNYKNHLKYITTSRRTPKEVEELIESYDFDYELIYSKEPDINPIPDFLHVCDELFISIDSTSMLSEARANSNAKINIIKLKSKKENTKFHKLAKTVESFKNRFDYTPYLKRVVL